MCRWGQGAYFLAYSLTGLRNFPVQALVLVAHEVSRMYDAQSKSKLCALEVPGGELVPCAAC